MQHISVENVSYSYYTLLTFLLSVCACIIVVLYQPLLLLFGGNLSVYSNYVFELALVFSSFIIYTPVWHCRNHLYLKTTGAEILRLTIYSNFLGLIIMALLIYILKDIGIYLGLAVLSLIQVIFFCNFTKNSFKVVFAYNSIIIGLSLLLTFSISTMFNLSFMYYFFMMVMLSIICFFSLRAHIPIIMDIKH